MTVRVRPSALCLFAVGQWVYYYNPRKLPGRQDKWRRKYTGPLLVVGVPGPVTLKLQRSRRAAPFYVHRMWQMSCQSRGWRSLQIPEQKQCRP